eukprot:CAMPEP_0177674060 /NCGR_PEP_ID=MMETSP0447-20121125/26330_1 /TAXON_ID=0 /ORGANISM="Stygamoeba regulata, Strain BSH-02190019" /LENGTH=381 /DNA_ID=CAMNT_0019182083 /DNA_START=93 /DNA_END=1238 /DNA_ORIENTATION=+
MAACGDEGFQSLVIDHGSAMIKAGYAGDDAPHSVFPSIVGLPIQPELHGMRANAWFAGDEAASKRGILRLNSPIERGVVTNFDDLDRLWHQTFYRELGVVPEEHSMLLIEPLLNPRENRERTAQLMFETYSGPALFLACDAVLAMYASGRASGLSITLGADKLDCVAVYEGHAMPHTATRLEVGGRQLDNHLMKLLTECGYSFTCGGERELVRDIKEKLCYVALDYEQELKHAASSSEREKTYELPDGQEIRLGAELFRCTEALFRPSLLGLLDAPSIQQCAYNSVLRADVTIRDHLLRACPVVLSGGPSMFAGIAERLRSELGALAGGDIRPLVSAPLDHKYSAWIGGSILASLSSFQNGWISREEYDEYGPSLVHVRCF